MRTTDSDPPPWKPLGKRVVPAKPATPEWQPKPGSPGIEEDTKGRLRTNLPLTPPKGTP